MAVLGGSAPDGQLMGTFTETSLAGGPDSDLPLQEHACVEYSVETL